MTGLMPREDDTHAPQVFIPTTGGPISIVRLRKVPGLPDSFVALRDDSRPLSLSKDYNDFVRGSLGVAIPDPGSFILMLDEKFDMGRSWHMPVLVAHLLRERSGSQPDGRKRAIWATGRVDPELNPVQGDYSVLRKLEQSRALFEDLRKDGVEVTAVMPLPRAAQERQQIETAFREIGIACHFPQNLAELSALFGNRPRPRRWLDRGRLPALGLGILAPAAAAVFLLSAAGLLPVFPSASSTADEDPVASLLGINVLYARTDEECQSRVTSKRTLYSQQAGSSPGGWSARMAQAVVCGLEFVNRTEKDLPVGLEPDLVNRGIRGSERMLAGLRLPPQSSDRLYLLPGTVPITTSIAVGPRQGSLVLEAGAP